jgi:hypothetical protein
MATSKYKRPVRIHPTVLLQPALDAKQIVRETLSVVRECVEALHPELSPLRLLRLNRLDESGSYRISRPVAPRG